MKDLDLIFNKEYFLSKAQVWYAGVGPGGLKHLSLEAYALIKNSNFILIENKQISPDIASLFPQKNKITNCALIKPQELAELISKNCKKDLLIARLVSGDPSIFSSSFEEIKELKALNIKVEVIPGISTALVLASRIQKSYTPKGQAQSLIISRLPVNQPLPEGQDIKNLARHGSSLILYLADRDLKNLAEELILAGLDPDSPVAMGTQLGWEDEEVLEISLSALKSYSGKNPSGTQRILAIFPKNTLE